MFGKKKNKAAEVIDNIPANDALQNTNDVKRGKKARKKKTDTSISKRYGSMPFFRNIKAIFGSLCIIMFLLSASGYAGFNVLGRMFLDVNTKNKDSGVTDLQKEFETLKGKYTGFQFDAYKRLLNKNKTYNESDDIQWGKHMHVFFGDTYLQQLRTIVDKLPDEGEEVTHVQQPNLVVQGVINFGDSLNVSIIYEGRPEVWKLQKKGGAWVCNELPPNYALGDVRLESRNGEPPYFEMKMQPNNNPIWKVALSSNAVNTNSRLTVAGHDNAVKPETDMGKFRAGGSYIMVTGPQGAQYIQGPANMPQQNIGSNQQGSQPNQPDPNTKIEMTPQDILKLLSMGAAINQQNAASQTQHPGSVKRKAGDTAIRIDESMILPGLRVKPDTAQQSLPVQQ